MPKDFTLSGYWTSIINASLCKFFILQVLNDRPAHGYEIAGLVSELTSGFCIPSQGTIYPVLKEFQQCGCVTWSPEKVRGRIRKVYSITESGRAAYNAGKEMWQKGLCCVSQAVAAATDGPAVDDRSEGDLVQ